MPGPEQWVKASSVAAAGAPIQSLAWELPYASDVAIKKEYSWFTVLCQFLLCSEVTRSRMYMHSPSCIIFHHGLARFPVPSSRASWLSHSKGSSLHLLTPDSQSLPLLLGNRGLFSLCGSVSVSR